MLRVRVTHFSVSGRVHLPTPLHHALALQTNTHPVATAGSWALLWLVKQMSAPVRSVAASHTHIPLAEGDSIGTHSLANHTRLTHSQCWRFA